MMAGRIEIALRHADRELEIVDGTRLPLQQTARVKHSAAIFEATQEWDFVALDHFHADLPDWWQKKTSTRACRHQRATGLRNREKGKPVPKMSRPRPWGEVEGDMRGVMGGLHSSTAAG